MEFCTIGDCLRGRRETLESSVGEMIFIQDTPTAWVYVINNCIQYVSILRCSITCLQVGEIHKHFTHNHYSYPPCLTVGDSS